MKFVLSLTGRPEVKADRVKLKELFLNLLDNAIRYTQPGGTVTLSSGVDLNRVTRIPSARVDPAEHLNHVFERFYRVAEGPRWR